MMIFNKDIITDFIQKHPTSAKPLNRWVAVVEEEKWTKFADVKKTFAHADLIEKDRICFNVGGNKYRLFAHVNYYGQIVVTECVLTHREYDKVNKRK